MQSWWFPHMYVWMWIFPLSFAAVCVFFLFAYLFRNQCAFCGRKERREFNEAAREILDRRYASGEITREQYEEMKRVLAG
jgi:putative membrane protein